MKKIVSIISVLTVSVLLGVLLIACAPQKPEDAKKKLEDKSYTVIVLDDALTTGTTALILGITTGDIDAIVLGTNGDDAAVLIYFKDSKTASSYVKDSKEKLEKYAGEQSKDKDAKIKVGVSGKVAYAATKKGDLGILF